MTLKKMHEIFLAYNLINDILLFDRDTCSNSKNDKKRALKLSEQKKMHFSQNLETE